jgi:hypothetical protein
MNSVGMVGIDEPIPRPLRACLDGSGPVHYSHLDIVVRLRGSPKVVGTLRVPYSSSLLAPREESQQQIRAPHTPHRIGNHGIAFIGLLLKEREVYFRGVEESAHGVCLLLCVDTPQ